MKPMDNRNFPVSSVDANLKVEFQSFYQSIKNVYSYKYSDQIFLKSDTFIFIILWQNKENLTLKNIIQFPQAPGIYHKTYGHISED